MFTGLVTHTGLVRAVLDEAGGRAFEIESGMEPNVGASVAHSGVCLTVTEKAEHGWRVYASPETLRRTSIGVWGRGTIVNLEASLRLGDELGGHLVFGHVDAVGDLVGLVDEGASHKMTFRLPEAMAPLVAVKGSIAVDGVSLTVTEATGDGFSVSVIPHSWNATTLKDRRLGDPVNLEADMLARYVARQLSFMDRAHG